MCSVGQFFRAALCTTIAPQWVGCKPALLRGSDPPPAPNGPSCAPPVEPAVPPSDAIDEVDELISTGSSGESQTKRQRQEPGSRGRPWKQPARYIKYTPPPSQRLEWWERASRLPVSAPAPTEPAPEAQGKAEGATAAAAAPVVEVDQAGLLKAEIEESEEWHFRCVTTTAALTGLVQTGRAEFGRAMR